MALVIPPSLKVTAETRPGIQQLIADLLDEAPATDGFRRALAALPLSNIQTEHPVAAGTWVIRRLAEQVRVRINADAVVYAAAATTRPTRSRPAAFLPGHGKNGHRQQPVTLAVPGFRTEVRVLRYSRWYKTDRRLDRYFQRWVSVPRPASRDGHLAGGPDSLSRRKPRSWPTPAGGTGPRAYLPVLPADPFHADGRPVGYVVMKEVFPDGSDRPLAYYDNGATDHIAIDPEPMYDWQQSQRPDGTASHRDIRQYRRPPRGFIRQRGGSTLRSTSQTSNSKAITKINPMHQGTTPKKNNDPKD